MGKKREMRTIFRFENLKGIDHLRDKGIDGRVTKWILKK